jgi:serine phosphatase RsbU (regulator of sigma subunit)
MTTPAPDSALARALPGLPAAEAARLLREGTLRDYADGSWLCRQGEPADTFFVVVAGTVLLTQRVGERDQRLVAQRVAGEFFGEMGLIEGKPRTASATARGRVTVLEVGEVALRGLLSRSPDAAMAMIRGFVTNVRVNGEATIRELEDKNAALRQAYAELEAAQTEVVRRERLEHELEIAGQVQAKLLPTHFPERPGLRFAARNQAARHVGGDLYDVIAIDDDHVGLLMADVADKSVRAALFMAVTRALFLAHARRSTSPEATAQAVHAGLLEVAADADVFVTAFYGVLNTQTGHLRYIRAGQDKPLWFRAGVEAPVELDADGRFLGMWPDLHLREGEANLQPGDVLVAYSDGVTDTRDVDDRVYGLPALITCVERHRRDTADAICSAIIHDVEVFRGLAEPSDDVTVLVVRSA